MIRRLIPVMVLVLCVPLSGLCGNADVVGVHVNKTGMGIFHFDVTVKHDDTGWDHYADKWDVLLPDGTVVGTRTLYHPHVDEQPFTRSLSGVRVPAQISEVSVRAHDSVHAYTGKTVTVTLPP